jgi:large subunit ribosomal protein L1
MPNPKTGTITPNVGQAVKEYSAGKMEFKNDESGNVHILLGKSSFSEEQLIENFKAFLEALQSIKPSALKKEFISAVTVNATMGPGIKVKI